MEPKDIGDAPFFLPVKAAIQQLDFSSSKWISDSILLGKKLFGESL